MLEVVDVIDVELVLDLCEDDMEVFEVEPGFEIAELFSGSVEEDEFVVGETVDDTNVVAVAVGDALPVVCSREDIGADVADVDTAVD